MATFGRPNPDIVPSNAARKIPAATLIACIEEALRILDDDLDDDVWGAATTSFSHTKHNRHSGSGSGSLQ